MTTRTIGRRLLAAAGLLGLAAALGAHAPRPASAEEEAAAAAPGKCPVSHADLLAKLKASVKASGGPTNGGLDFNMWATVVTRDGFVCEVAFSGGDRNSEWPLSRIISAQKAHTANGLSLDGFALSTANLYAAVQPGGSLFGLQESNPVDASRAYLGPPSGYGQDNDPLAGKKIGGVNVFGGGLALYAGGKVVGGLGVSGDTSCADHNVAFRVRKALALDKVPAGVGPNNTDGINYSKNPTGFQHPFCGNNEQKIARQIGAGQ